MELLYPQQHSYLCRRNIQLFSNLLVRVRLIAVSLILSHCLLQCLYECETFLTFIVKLEVISACSNFRYQISEIKGVDVLISATLFSQMLLHLDDPIQCNGSAPTVNLGESPILVLNISYPEKVIAVQDQVISHYLAVSNCSFLYNFTVPVHHFNLSSDIFSKSLSGGSDRKTKFSSGFPTLESPKSPKCAV